MTVAARQSASLDRKKFFGDPVLVVTIVMLIVLLLLFIVYPLAILLVDSVLVRQNDLYSAGELASGEIAWYDQSGNPVTGSGDAIFAKLTSVEEGGEDRYVPVYATTGLFPRQARLQDAGGPVYLRVVNSNDRPTWMDIGKLTEVASTPMTYKPNGRLIKNMDGVEPGDICVQIRRNNWSLDAFPRIFKDYTFNHALRNTLLLGMLTGFGSLVIGLLFAYVDVYVRIRSRVIKKLFDVVSMLPVVSPPFVLSLSMVLLFGKSGLITRKILGIYDANVYGMWGIVIVQTLTFFPVVYLMLKGLLKNIDPSMEEAARDMGATRMKVFTTVTLPPVMRR